MIKTYDEILKLRRSTRVFTDEVPPKDLIYKIIEYNQTANTMSRGVSLNLRNKKIPSISEGDFLKVL